MGRLGKKQPPEQAPTVEAGRDVPHARELAATHLDQVLDHPAIGGDLRADIEEVEQAQQPDGRPSQC